MTTIANRTLAALLRTFVVSLTFVLAIFFLVVFALIAKVHVHGSRFQLVLLPLTMAGFGLP